MAILAVRAVDKINSDCPYLDAKCLKAGDVVEVLPDGWKFGPGDLADLRLVEVACDVEDLCIFLEREAGDPLENRMLQLRACWFDLEAWSGKPLTLKGAFALRRVSDPLTDPNIL